MKARPAAVLPPAGLPGLDPAWSRLVEATGTDGRRHTWHVLDSWNGRSLAAAEPVGTLLCVHGNPTWSYLWRSVLAGAPDGWRVVALDHLGMGFSDRVEQPQRLADRVADLAAVVDALGVTGPVVTVAHDWGGAISLGWAVAHRDQLAGVVLLNTAISQPPGSPVPALIALARTPGVLRTSCVATPAFLDGTLRLAHPALPPDVRAAFRAPYRGAARRTAIGDFVADIPLSSTHPTHPTQPTLDAIAEGLGSLADIPVLLLWGPRDPVFSDRYLRDLVERLPQAEVHRYEGAGHLVVEDRDVAGAIATWLPRRVAPVPAPAPASAAGDGGRRRALWTALDERAEAGVRGSEPAIVEMAGRTRRGPAAEGRTVTFEELAAQTRELAAGLVAHGVEPGDRVALLVPPGIDLAAAVYACWRIGAVIVLADAGLGLRGMSRALRGAGPRHVIGIPKALAAARALRWPGDVVAVGAASRATLRAVGARTTLADIARRGRGLPDPPAPGGDDEAAILFTSGATGPAKGVVYRHRQLEAQRDLLVASYGITADDRLVAAFAPFALYGPALGIASVVPAMDVTAPSTLDAQALADAAAAVDATLVFGSPAALVNVVATADFMTPAQRTALQRVRLLLSAGAPVPASLLRATSRLVPHAELHTPYGMTEVLPVADVTLDEIEAAGPGNGVCVGRPMVGVVVALRPLDGLGRPGDTTTDKPGVTGEICVSAAHVKDRYDRLWVTDDASTDGEGDRHWHRTGDVGHLDDDGRLWVEGRLGHVVTSAEGVVTPVGVEQRIEALPAVATAAVVGVGPAGTQAVVAVVTLAAGPAAAHGHGGLAAHDLASSVRAAAAGTGGAGGVELAAVLVVPALPVDIRHNSKIDRVRVGAWAGRVLAGGRPTRLA